MEAKCWAQLTNSATWVKEISHVSKIIPKIYKTCIEFSISAKISAALGDIPQNVNFTSLENADSWGKLWDTKITKLNDSSVVLRQGIYWRIQPGIYHPLRWKCENGVPIPVDDHHFPQLVLLDTLW